MRSSIVTLLALVSGLGAQGPTCSLQQPCGMPTPFLRVDNCAPSRQEVRTRQDMDFIDRQYRQFLKLTPGLLKKALESPDPLYRVPALQAAGERERAPRHDFLIAIRDPDNLVRQAGRRALAIQSADALDPGWRRTRKIPVKYVDFGPPAGATLQQATAAQALWQAWWEEADQKHGRLSGRP